MRSAMGAKVGISGDGAHASWSQEVLKEKEHTKHNSSQLCFSQPTYQGCTTQGRAAKKKCNFSSDVGGYTVWERSGDLCGFWRRSGSVTLFTAPAPVLS